MNNKIALKLITLLVGFAIMGIACNSPIRYESFSGETMGTYYRVKGQFVNADELRTSVDSLLMAINNEVSTYIESSTISLYNQEPVEFSIKEDNHPHFEDNWYNSMSIYKITDGDFDPTVGSLVNYWGFGPNKKSVKDVDTIRINVLLQSVGMSRIDFHAKDNYLIFKKDNPDIKLDFSAIAKGYAVDQIGVLLQKKGWGNYLIDIGGEILARGVNQKQKPWTLAISKPDENASPTEYVAVLKLKDIAMATSGNYRNFYSIDGKKYGHTIDPKTGYPAGRLLSASILAKTCQEADAIATACMVKGWPGAMQFINAQENLEGLFIYADNNNEPKIAYTTAIEQYIIK